MEKKDIAKHLASWGWQVKKDNVGDKSGKLSLPDREVWVHWTLRGLYRRETRRRTQKLGLSPSITTIEFSKMTCYIDNAKSYETWPIQVFPSAFFREEETINIDHLKAVSEEAIAWAKEQDLNACLQKHANLPTDAPGSAPLKHLTSLAILGDVDKLKYYQTSFENGDRLGFVPYIKKNYIDRAYAAASESSQSS